MTNLKRLLTRPTDVLDTMTAATDPWAKKPTPPVPPSVVSLIDGVLKDTPANRALHPEITPQAQFEKRSVVKNARFHDSRTLIFQGDVRAALQHLIDEAVQVDCIVTSPPFYGQRDYGVDGQIGLEEHPQQFIDNLVEVFELCRRVLRDTGSLWVNLGDTYWSGKGAHKSKEVKQSARRFGVRPQDRPGDGKWTKPKQLLLIPHRFAIAMQDAGWLVRNDNVWVKPNPVPDQVRDRCSMSHEYVFHFTKERWYYFNRLAVGREMPTGKLLPPLDTWVVPPSRGTNGDHKAAFSEELVRLPILGSTPPAGIVLDPFAGSGTSLVFARRNGFRSIGIDLKADYCDQAASAILAIDKESATE
jgi:site-specific DNA-methyltransferase (adenine-specific)